MAPNLSHAAASDDNILNNAQEGQSEQCRGEVKRALPRSAPGAMLGARRCKANRPTRSRRRCSELDRLPSGHGDYAVLEISGHSATRMLARYTHPTEERKIGALHLPAMVT